MWLLSAVGSLIFGQARAEAPDIISAETCDAWAECIRASVTSDATSTSLTPPTVFEVIEACSTKSRKYTCDLSACLPIELPQAERRGWRVGLTEVCEEGRPAVVLTFLEATTDLACRCASGWQDMEWERPSRGRRLISTTYAKQHSHMVESIPSTPLGKGYRVVERDPRAHFHFLGLGSETVVVAADGIDLKDEEAAETLFSAILQGNLPNRMVSYSQRRQVIEENYFISPLVMAAAVREVLGALDRHATAIATKARANRLQTIRLEIGGRGPQIFLLSDGSETFRERQLLRSASKVFDRIQQASLYKMLPVRAQSICATPITNVDVLRLVRGTHSIVLRTNQMDLETTQR